jgi:Cu/Ag efflux pump CusA
MTRSRPTVTDHALLRFLERAGGMPVEQIREALAASLERAATAALGIAQSAYVIRADGLVYRVKDSIVVTIIADEGPHAETRASAKKSGRV